MVCPHAVIRIERWYEPELLASAPETFKSPDSKFKEFPGMQVHLQVASEDCTGCQLCVEVCPAKDKTAVGRKAINMEPQPRCASSGSAKLGLLPGLPDPGRRHAEATRPRQERAVAAAALRVLGACAGCGETPYLKLVSQLFGDRSVIANATGCSSIYGGNLPTTPWSQNPKAAARPGPTRCSKTTPSSAWACA
jgi:pyruvate-ferredoxin/flavodoxin oxidoreductase